MQNIGMALRLERVRQRRTLKEVALQSGVHPTTLSQIETGRVNANSEELVHICDALGLSAEEVSYATLG